MKKLHSILYVEDEKTTQTELIPVLEEFCDKLYVAENGAQALRYYKDIKPQLVISDVKMPIMDGLKLSEKIKEIKEDQHILLVTAFSDQEYLKQAIELHVTGYLLKPIDLEILEKKIEYISDQFELKNDLHIKEQILIQQSKLASMGEMLGNISHQLKQPLSVISTLSSSLKVIDELKQTDEGVSQSNKIEYYDTILSQVEYISHTIDDFKNFLNPSNVEYSFNIKEFLEKCITLVNSSFKDHEIATIKQIDFDINSYGNPNYLVQAILNILNNARDALESAKDIHQKLVFVFLIKKYKDCITIEIKDNAGGIPTKIIDKIFDKYFTTKGELKGTGLGLYMTKMIITDKLNGKITVENEEFIHDGNKYIGAKFLITIPSI